MGLTISYKEPETGWNRYDTLSKFFHYIGDWVYEYDNSSSGSYGYDRICSRGNVGNKVVFWFKGTSFRIITIMMLMNDENNKVYIDGTDAGNYGIYVNGRIDYACVFEKIGLEDKVHKIEIETKGNVTRWDCVDIVGEMVGTYTVYKPVKTKKWYGVIGGKITKMTDNDNELTDSEKITLFKSTNYERAATTDLQALGTLKILTFSETNEKFVINITAVPKDQLVTPKGLINVTAFKGIDNATLTATISGSGSCKLLVTTDLMAYKTYDLAAQEWQAIDHTDIAAVKAFGIDAVQLQNIDHAAWDKLIAGKTGIGFAYLLSIDNVADVGKIDQLNLQVDMKGSWKKAVHGTDYDYEYPANNLLQVSIKTNGDYKINYSE